MPTQNYPVHPTRLSRGVAAFVVVAGLVGDGLWTRGDVPAPQPVAATPAPRVSGLKDLHVWSRGTTSAPTAAPWIHSGGPVGLLEESVDPALPGGDTDAPFTASRPVQLVIELPCCAPAARSSVQVDAGARWRARARGAQAPPFDRA